MTPPSSSASEGLVLESHDSNSDDDSRSSDPSDSDGNSHSQLENVPQRTVVDGENEAPKQNRNRNTTSSDNHNNHPRRTKQKKPKGPSHHEKRVRPRIPILQYHNDFVCVNKPAGMTVHRNGDRLRRNQLVVSTTLKRQLSRKVWPVHRLDHRTSGALLFAFSSQVCGQLHASLTHKEHEDGSSSDASAAAVKDYIALVRGDWGQLPETLLVDRPITVDGVERESQTEFQLLASIVAEEGNKSNSNEDTTSANSHKEDTYQYQGACSLVRCRLLTGRKHQIRRHAFAIGHPVLGDSEHGDSKCNRWWRQHRGLDRLFLHCLALDLPPLQHDTPPSELKSSEAANHTTRIQCVAPLSPELVQVLRRADMKDLWQAALKKDPRLALEPYDERGGTMGRGAKVRQTMTAEQGGA